LKTTDNWQAELLSCDANSIFAPARRRLFIACQAAIDV
jgi:hypothetical protein